MREKFSLDQNSVTENLEELIDNISLKGFDWLRMFEPLVPRAYESPSLEDWRHILSYVGHKGKRFD